MALLSGTGIKWLTLLAIIIVVLLMLHADPIMLGWDYKDRYVRIERQKRSSLLSGHASTFKAFMSPPRPPICISSHPSYSIKFETALYMLSIVLVIVQ